MDADGTAPLRLYDPDLHKPRPREWPAMDIARRRGCNSVQQSLLVWLYAQLAYQPGTAAVAPVDAIRAEVVESESQFRRALDGLERLGLVQADGERSRPGRKVLHVLRTYQPELQQYIDWPEDGPAETQFKPLIPGAASKSTSTPLRDTWSPRRAAADNATPRDAEGCGESRTSGTEAANRRLRSTQTLSTSQSLGGVKEQGEAGRIVASGPEASVNPAEAVHRWRGAVAGAAAPERAIVGTQTPGATPIGDVLPGLMQRLPNRRGLAAVAAGICEQLRALGDPNPTSGQTKGFAWKLAILMHLGDSVVREIEQLMRQAQGKRSPHRWFCRSVKEKFAERGMWDELVRRNGRT